MKDTREYILTTSLLLFLRKSYRDVTMKEIVEKTGLSKGAFYHYFTSKEQLFKEIAKMFFSMGTVDYEVFRTDSLKLFYNQYADFLNKSILRMNNLVKEPSGRTGSLNFFLILFEAVGRFPEFLTMELKLYKMDVEAWVKVIASSRKSGEIKSACTDEEIARLFLYCNDGVFIRSINNDRQGSYKEYLLSAYDSLYKNLKT